MVVSLEGETIMKDVRQQVCCLYVFCIFEKSDGRGQS